MKNNLISFFILFCSTCSFSQKKITWNHLADINYTEKYFKDQDSYFLYPKFSKKMTSLVGKQVSLTGYFLSFDVAEKLYILSKGPMSACFFCGNGGPETAVELQFNTPPNYSTDDIVTVTGILELNKDDVLHFNYIFKNCKTLIIKQ